MILEVIIYCNHGGQLMQNYPFETELFKDLIGQINSANFECHELAAIWLYMKS